MTGTNSDRPNPGQIDIRTILSGVPRSSYLLAGVGNLFLGLGLYGFFVSDEQFLKDFLDVNENALLLLALGVLFSLPLYISVAKRALEHADGLDDR